MTLVEFIFHYFGLPEEDAPDSFDEWRVMWYGPGREPSTADPYVPEWSEPLAQGLPEWLQKVDKIVKESTE
jgi:hypothetical protein